MTVPGYYIEGTTIDDFADAMTPNPNAVPGIWMLAVPFLDLLTVFFLLTAEVVYGLAYGRLFSTEVNYC